ncbi:MAG: alpha/beta fold hydrolase [Lentisphaerae bacterium]|nr:alpha/beta fold hydrolase [Lentisphaerota bacterium]
MSVYYEQPILLPSGSDTITGYLYAPDRPVRTLLILPPLVEERKACHRFLHDLARSLAAAGILSLRIDYRGTADSGGTFSSFSCNDWQADATIAFNWLANHTPHLTPAILGIRIGATIASLLPPPCSARFLIEPLSGTDFTRQLLQRHQINQMLAYGKAQITRAEIEAGWKNGATADLDGYAVTAKLATDLTNLNYKPWHEPGCVITTGTTKATTSQNDTPNAAHIPLRLPAFWNAVGHVDLSLLTSTLTDSIFKYHPATTTPKPLSPPPPIVATPIGSPLAITAPNGTISAWLDPPPTTTPQARILFVHGWSGDRTGPHRMFTTFGRQLAQQGILSLRIDLSGRGESKGDPNTATIADMTADTVTALDWLRQHHPHHGPLIVVAICSGCKVAISAAAGASDVDALVLWSAESMGSLRSEATGRRKTAAALKSYARKLCRRETWQKILTGRVRSSMVARAIVGHETRSACEAVAEDTTLNIFRNFPGRLLFLFGGSDPDAPGSSTAYESYCRRHKIDCTLHTIPHAGHSFYNTTWESSLLNLSTNFINTVVAAAKQKEQS